MNAKFYHASNSNRFRYTKDGSPITFRSYAYVGGSWSGVLETSNPAEQEALDAMIAEGDLSVQSITKAEYDAIAKKDRPDAPLTYGTPPTVTTKSPGLSISEKPAVVVEDPSGREEPPAPITDAPLETVADALNVGEVSAPSPAKASKAKRASSQLP